MGQRTQQSQGAMIACMRDGMGDGCGLEESFAVEPLRVLKGGCNSKMAGIPVRQHKAANGGKSLQEQARMSREFQKWRCWCGVGCMHARAEIESRMHEILARCSRFRRTACYPAGPLRRFACRAEGLAIRHLCRVDDLMGNRRVALMRFV